MPPLTGDRLILAHNRAVGDVVCMTAAVRDLHRAYPGRFTVAVDTTCRDVWRHNPHVVPLPNIQDRKGWPRYSLSYGHDLARAAKNGIHFLLAWHRDLERQTGLTVPLTDPVPDLHLGPDEQTPVVAGRYWVVAAGGKSDFTTKWGHTAGIQQVVDVLAGIGVKAVQVGATGGKPAHWNPELRGVENLVGRTTLREYFRLIARADGVLCTITSAMHVAAAFRRPCVVWAGGREEPWWEAYTNAYPGQFGPAAGPVPVPHRYLHTLGLLPCCPETKACWANKTVTDGNDRSVCKRPVAMPSGQALPECQALITPEKVAENVLAYYLDGTLSPP